MAITREYLAELCDARDKICGFCEAKQCEKCIVTNLINNALAECTDIEESEGNELVRGSEGPFECMSEYCAYNPYGICRFAVLHHRKPVFSEKRGCEDFCYMEKGE